MYEPFEEFFHYGYAVFIRYSCGWRVVVYGVDTAMQRGSYDVPRLPRPASLTVGAEVCFSGVQFYYTYHDTYEEALESLRHLPEKLREIGFGPDGMRDYKKR